MQSGEEDNGARLSGMSDESVLRAHANYVMQTQLVQIGASGLLYGPAGGAEGVAVRLAQDLGAVRTGTQIAKGATELLGAARGPNYSWARNANGLVRTADEALALAKSRGVNIGEDVQLLVDDELGMIKDIEGHVTHASYFDPGRVFPNKMFTWNDLAPGGRVRIWIRPEILGSDEAITAVLAHEFHEINALRQIFKERGSMSAAQLREFIDPRAGGFLHEEAWDVSNELLRAMRSNSP